MTDTQCQPGCAAPEIRKTENGDIVVDFGREWFRIRKDGSAVKKWIKKRGPITSVEARAATPAEREKIWALAFPLEDRT